MNVYMLAFIEGAGRRVKEQEGREGEPVCAGRQEGETTGRLV